MCGQGFRYRNAFHEACPQSFNHYRSGRGCNRPFRITFFGMPYLRNMLKPGMTYVFRGVCQEGKPLRMEQPRIYKPEEYALLQGTLQPRYALTMGLTNNGVSKAVRRALESITLTEYLPADIREEFRLIPYADALERSISPEYGGTDGIPEKAGL